MSEGAALPHGQLRGRRARSFFESRYKSVTILDEGTLLAACAYIDQDPVAAGIAVVPKAGQHNSIKARVEPVRTAGSVEDLEAAGADSVAGSAASAGLENSLWYCPVEDRREPEPAAREGMMPGLPLGSYLVLVDYTDRLLREGKAAILDRLGPTRSRGRGGYGDWPVVGYWARTSRRVASG